MPTWEADNPILQRRLGSAGVALIYFRVTQISETAYLVDLDKWACSPFWSSLVFSRTQSFSSLLCLYALSTVYYGFTKMGAWKMLKNRIREYRAKYDMKQEDLARRRRSRKLQPGLIGSGRNLPVQGSQYGPTLKRELPMWRMMTFIPC